MAYRIRGCVLPRTAEPDGDGDVFDWDGVGVPYTYTPLWRWSATTRLLGMVTVTKTDTGVYVEGLTTHRVSAARWALAGTWQIEWRDGPRVLRCSLRRVALVPVAEARTPGTAITGEAV